MTEVFSASVATAGKPRLVWTDSVHGPTEMSMREGIRSYAIGISQAIRNPAVNESSVMSEQEAVEQLAALSVLLRWVDVMELDLHADDPDPDPRA